jgi:hypothetical protein
MESCYVSPLDLVQELDTLLSSGLPAFSKPVMQAYWRPLFGISPEAAANVYFRYYANKNELSRRDYVMALHWMKTYPSWVDGSVRWEMAEKSYRDTINRAIDRLFVDLNEVSFFSFFSFFFFFFFFCFHFI